jgi:hypothetical protein
MSYTKIISLTLSALALAMGAAAFILNQSAHSQPAAPVDGVVEHLVLDPCSKGCRDYEGWGSAPA